MPQKLQFIKNSQPKFIQQFKERVGLAQTTTVNDKVYFSVKNNLEYKLKNTFIVLILMF